MNKKEELRQKLLEQTFSRKTHRSMYSTSDDLSSILKYQQESLEELTKNTSKEDLKKINEEIQKDFGLSTHSSLDDIEKVNQELEKDFGIVSQSSLDDLSKELKNKWHYDEFIDSFISIIKKSIILDKKEYSLLYYNYLDIDHVLNDMTSLLSKNQYLINDQISMINFEHYNNKIELFYQDMYDCLYSHNQVIIFDHIELLPKAFVQSMISLLKDKRIPMLNRYIENKGTLTLANNQLVKNAISELTWNNKYIILLSHVSLDDLTDTFGNPFVNAIDEIKAFKQLNHQEYQILIQDKINSFIQRINQHYHIEIKENIIDYINNHHIDDIDHTLEQLFEEVLEYDFNSNIEIIYEDHLYLVIDQKRYELLKEDLSNFEEIDLELQSLVGLKKVKEYLESLKTYYSALQKRKAAGKKVADVSKHMIFTGNPGTGKTTVARILAKYLKASNILESGHLIEVTRKDLVGQYVGHTAQLTNQVITSALGGVLFIDEAYSLYRGGNDSYGLEAIDTLVKCMEDYRDELVVVLAGYQKEMDDFLTSNSGLRSRFSNIIHFDDYTGEELYLIASSIAKSKDYIIDEESKDTLTAYLSSQNMISGGNGRLARNMVEKAMINHSKRNGEDDLLLIDDFIEKGSEIIE